MYVLLNTVFQGAEKMLPLLLYVEKETGFFKGKGKKTKSIINVKEVSNWLSCKHCHQCIIFTKKLSWASRKLALQVLSFNPLGPGADSNVAPEI